MKEYTITLSFTVESEEADYERVSEFAEKLSENIMDYEMLIYDDDIEVTSIEVTDIENISGNSDDEYFEGDDD